MVDYQNFLKVCEQLHDFNIQCYQRIQITLRLLNRVKSTAAPFSRRSIQNLDEILDKVLWVNQWMQALLKQLHENATDCSEDAVDHWFCHLLLEDQRNSCNFLETQYRALDGLIAKLGLHYPHEQIPGFHYGDCLKKILQSLQHTYQQQKRAIHCFEHDVAACKGFEHSDGSGQFLILIQYCNFSCNIAKSLQFSMQSNSKNRPLFGTGDDK